VTRTATSVSEVVKSGLCIGCGLCEAATGGRVPMAMTDYGSLRPSRLDAFTRDEESLILSACPGVTVEPRLESMPQQDPVWGAFSDMRLAWAGDTEIRFRGSAGGVLSAIGAYLVRTGQAQFILHAGADPVHPMRSRWVLSETAEQVIANAGSRYGPVAPLAGLEAALARDDPFAIIAKPCDLGAVHRFARSDPRIDRLCIARLTMVCGGQSRLGKSADVLSELGVAEAEVSLFRYRGYGNPGRTRIETHDGRAFEKTYLEMWADEAGWKIETRCNFCPDALGEAADIAVADVWPGGSPTGEDAGFNAIIVRSKAGEALVAEAAAAGDLILGEPVTPRHLDDCQPHQVRKKRALAARFSGRAEAGLPEIAAAGLRIDELGQDLDEAARRGEAEGTLRRARAGRFTELGYVAT